MVEGPGTTRNGRKVQRAVGRYLVHADLPPPTTTKNRNDDALATSLIGRELIDAFSIGKELFLIFSKIPSSSSSPSSVGIIENENNKTNKEIAIRLHFGMNGCLYVYYAKSKTTPIPAWRDNTKKHGEVVAPPFKLCFGEKVNTTTKKTAGETTNSTSLSNEVTSSLSSHFSSIASETAKIIDLTLASDNNDDTNDNLKSTRDKRRLDNPSFDTSQYSDIPTSSPPKKQKSTQKTTHSPPSTVVSLIVEARATTISGPFSSTAPQTKLTRLSSHDVCSSSFHAPSVFQTLRNISNTTIQSNNDVIIADAILNQDYFPGVGNVIK
eukprot:2366122-Ditylum_brightwellii.AAC.1